MPTQEQSVRQILENKHKKATPGTPAFIVDGALIARINQIDADHQKLLARIADMEAAFAKLL